VALALVLGWEGWKTEEAERCRLAALNCRAEQGGDNRARQLRYLEAATQLVPDDAVLQLRLASAYQEAFQGRLREVEVEGRAAGAGEDELALRYRKTAIRHYLRARHLCPLLVEPHIRLAGAPRLFQRCDPPHRYLERALLLLPCDARIWYVAGLQDLDDGRTEQAWNKWRRSLDCSDRHLADILNRSAEVLPPDDVVGMVLPDRPELLYAAGQLAENAGPADVAPCCYKKALTLLDSKPNLSADECRLKGRLHRTLGQLGPATEAYEAAVNRKPSEADWHFELAHLLYEQDRLSDARREARAALALNPGHTAARELQEKILRREAE
jgi:tetratricopeptide (TPR) repeat protein